jgi:hypothetical protein
VFRLCQDPPELRIAREETDILTARVSTFTTLQRAGALAFTWALLFALLSFYWAGGGSLGIDQLSSRLREEAGKRNPGFVAVVWLSGVMKLIDGLFPLALAFGLGMKIPRRLLATLTWLGGVFLTVYGCGDLVGGTIRGPEDNSQNVFWYAVLWGPIWLIGGMLFLATAWSHRRIGPNGRTQGPQPFTIR